MTVAMTMTVAMAVRVAVVVRIVFHGALYARADSRYTITTLRNLCRAKKAYLSAFIL
jgi:hypothetical protein